MVGEEKVDKASNTTSEVSTSNIPTETPAEAPKKTSEVPAEVPAEFICEECGKTFDTKRKLQIKLIQKLLRSLL